MSSSKKLKKRLDRLARCVKANDIDKLEFYVGRKKYSKLNLDEAIVNQRKETLLHLACRLCKHQHIEFLLKHSLGDPTSRDSKGNTPLHLALKAVMKVDDKNEFISAYRRIILAHLKYFSESLTMPNLEGQSGKDLLDLADTVYQYHLGTSSRRNTVTHMSQEQEWRSKLADELDDEYGSSWGKYETDFLQTDIDGTETYDSWAERMISEHKKKMRLPKQDPLPKSKVQTSSWTPEDQERFIQEEETKRQLQKAKDMSQKHFQFLSKFQILLQSESTIEATDLPFSCSDEVESIGHLLLMNIKDLKDVEAKRKALRELQRLWHPDKFSQKFGQRLNETIRHNVLKKVTEISQYLNMFNCLISTSMKD